MKIGVIGAMDAEVRDLEARLDGRVDETRMGLTFRTGRLEGVDVVIVQSGVGKVNAALCAQCLALVYKVDAIINTGIAGAIDKRLRVGDFVVSTDALYHDMDATYFGYKPSQIPGMKVWDFPADEKLVSLFAEAFAALPGKEKGKMLAGRVASGDQFIASPEAKKRVDDACHPLCCEMEGAAIAHAAYVNGVPFVIVRCLSDQADDSEGRIAYDFNENLMARRSAALVAYAIGKMGGR